MSLHFRWYSSRQASSLNPSRDAPASVAFFLAHGSVMDETSVSLPDPEDNHIRCRQDSRCQYKLSMQALLTLPAHNGSETDPGDHGIIVIGLHAAACD